MPYTRRWTAEEDSTLLTEVSKSPENLQKAFKITGELVNRTPNACAYRWYSSVRHNTSSIAFTLVGAHGASKNSKIGGDTKKVNKTLWERIKSLFK